VAWFRYRRIQEVRGEGIMRKPKLRELGEAIKALVIGPYTTKFPFAPPDIAPEYKGFPEYQDDGCVRCGGCAELCPTHTIKAINKPEEGVRVMFRDYANCMVCGQCQLYCLTGEGIVMTNEYDKTTFDKTKISEEIEDELVFCECCGELITTKRHMDWIAERLGELAYANPTFFVWKGYETGFADKDSGPNRGELLREDHMRVLCPNCRRNLVYKEDWGG